MAVAMTATVVVQQQAINELNEIVKLLETRVDNNSQTLGTAETTEP